MVRKESEGAQEEEETEGGLSVTLSCLSLWLRIGNLSRGCPLLLVLLGLSLHFWWDNTPTPAAPCVSVCVCVCERERERERERAQISSIWKQCFFKKCVLTVYVFLAVMWTQINK